MPKKKSRNPLLRGGVILLCLTLSVVAVAQAPTLRASRYHTITGHTEESRQIAFSPDARLLATSSVDSTVRLWSVGDGKLVRTLRHPEAVTSIAFSPDGQWLVSGSYDGKARVWDVHAGTLARALTGHTGTVWTVAFSPDGQRIASSGEDKTIKLWRTDTGALVRTLTGSKEAVVDIAFSPDGQLLASGGDDSLLRLWRVSDGSLVRSIAGSDHIYGVAFSGDGKWIASGGRARGNLATLWQQFFGNRLLGGNGKTARLWRVSDGALQQELSGHSDDVWSVALSPDGRWLATGSEDKTVVIWRLTTAGH